MLGKRFRAYVQLTSSWPWAHVGRIPGNGRAVPLVRDQMVVNAVDHPDVLRTFPLVRMDRP